MESFSQLNSAERIIAVHAAYGKAMIAAHSLELRIAAILFARAEEDVKIGKSVDSGAIDRLTLGQLINRFLLEFSPPEELAKELDDMLYFRNELAHRISKTILSAAQRKHWEEKVVSELYEISSYFAEASHSLQPFIDAFLSKHGLTLEPLLDRLLVNYPGIRQGANNSFKPKPLRGST